MDNSFERQHRLVEVKTPQYQSVLAMIPCGYIALTILLAGKGDANRTNNSNVNLDSSEEYEYDPHKGYEPYWEEGGWVAQDPGERMPPNTTTEKIQTVCGEECNYIYRKLGNVCAHHSSDRTLVGCDPNDISYFSQLMNFASHVWTRERVYPCRAAPVPDVLTGYITFPSYCDFLNTRCRQGRIHRLIFVHAGACRHQWSYYKNPRFPVDILKTNKDYLTPLKAKYPELFKKP